jgi:hypothetical protein
LCFCRTLEKALLLVPEAGGSAFLGHSNATLDAFGVPAAERGRVLAFIQSIKTDVVEA